MSRDIDLIAAYSPFERSPRERRRPRARRYVVVDVFSDTALAGNPLGVFTDGREIPPSLMQRLARELNLSETVFVLPAVQGGDARLRIFTPTRELPFAGHPVLGSAIVIGSALTRTSLTLETGLGPIALELQRSGDRIVTGVMRQAIPSWKPYEREPELLRALGVARSGLPVEAYENGPLHVYVELDGERAVAACSLPARACLRIRPRDRRQGRSRFISAATVGSRSDSGSRSARARRSVAHRSCSRARRARPSTSSGWR